MKHAYLIMAHNEWDMLNKLIQALDYPNNDIYLHIDKKADLKKVNIYKTKYSKAFLQKRMVINWGGHSQIKCVLIMLQKARKKEYDYYHLLSGVDIPLKRQSEIHDFFEKNKGKNFLEFDKKIDYSKTRLREYHWFQELIGRNKGIVPEIFYRVEKMSIFVQKKLGVNRLKNAEWEIFKGEHWFSITKELVDEIIKNKSKIRKTFYYAICADEMYIQTVAMNSYLAESVVEDNLRFIDWNRGTPYIFRSNDYDELCSSSKLFARKFSSGIDKEIIECLYKRLQG